MQRSRSTHAPTCPTFAPTHPPSGAHFPPGSPNSLTFGEWLGGRPELRSILERLLRFNPASALGLNKAPDALAASEWHRMRRLASAPTSKRD